MARFLVLEIAKGIDNSVTLLMKLSELHTSTHTPPSPPLPLSLPPFCPPLLFPPAVSSKDCKIFWKN